jgi:pimeloyl-ACP methyl ester carboxylesterase
VILVGVDFHPSDLRRASRPCTTPFRVRRWTFKSTRDILRKWERRDFRHDGLRFSFLDSGGDGDVLIALHAHLMEAVTYGPLAAALPKSRVVALDQRGHGSSDHARSYTRNDYIQDVKALLEHLDLNEAVLLGNSLGGANAYQFAARHPERVRGALSLKTWVPKYGMTSALCSPGRDNFQRARPSPSAWGQDSCPICKIHSGKLPADGIWRLMYVTWSNHRSCCAVITGRTGSPRRAPLC